MNLFKVFIFTKSDDEKDPEDEEDDKDGKLVATKLSQDAPSKLFVAYFMVVSGQF